MPDRQKILVAEGDRNAALQLAAVIRQQGWEALAASDAPSTLSVAMKSRPDVIVVNARLPGGGLEVLKRLRNSSHTAVVPVVVTGLGVTAEGQQWLMAGAQEALPGPLDSASTCAAVQRHLARPMTVAVAPEETLRSAARLAALKASGLLDGTPEVAYDRVTQLVARLLAAPTALLSIVDKDRQYFRSQVGLGEPWAAQRQTPLSHSFCQWVVSGKERVAVDDARAHPLLRTNLAIRDLGVIAYAGVPVCSGSGEAPGSLCAIDAKPRQWSDQDLLTLQDLTKLVEGGAAHAELTRQPPTHAADFDRYVDAAGAAVAGALSILRRRGAGLAQAEREALLDLIAQYTHHLVQLNRMIQVTKALH